MEGSFVISSLLLHLPLLLAATIKGNGNLTMLRMAKLVTVKMALCGTSMWCLVKVCGTGGTSPSGNLTILGTRMGVWYLMLLNTKWVLFGNKRVRYMIHLCWYLTEPKAVPFDYTFIKWPVLDDTWWYSDGWTDCTFIFLLHSCPGTKQQTASSISSGIGRQRDNQRREPAKNPCHYQIQLLQIHKCCKYRHTHRKYKYTDKLLFRQLQATHRQ